ncbi:MAG: hypothetical protein PHV82_01385 [Victivallaceae bacterium]|nr:hypothetical protein [Victivallaceae bacterium]
MNIKAFKYICLVYLTLFTVILTAKEQVKTVPYMLLQHSNNKNPVFVGLVKRSRSAKLSFLSYVQVTYVIPVNEIVRGRIINTEGKVIRKGDILAEAQNDKEQILVNISSEKAKNAKQALNDVSAITLRKTFGYNHLINDSWSIHQLTRSFDHKYTGITKQYLDLKDEKINTKQLPRKRKSTV